MNSNNRYSEYPMVDSTVGTRLVLGFIVPAESLQLRISEPWQLSSTPPPSYAAALGASTETVPRGSVPGRYHDALPARVRHESHVIGEGISSTVTERWELSPASGGMVELQITFQRSALVRVVGDRPDFPVWGATDTGILRIYQEDSLFEVIRNDALGVDHVQEIRFGLRVPEFSDLFNGQERLVSIFGNPHYTRRVFSPVLERAVLA